MGRPLALIWLSVILIFAPSLAPVAAVSFGFDQPYTISPMGVVFDAPTKQMAMSFVLPQETFEVVSAKVFVQKTVGSPYPMTVELRADVGGAPTGSLIAQGSFVPPAWGWASVSLTPHPDLTPGVRYHLVIRPGNGYGDEDNYVLIPYQMSRYQPSFSQLMDLGVGWYTHPNADPSIILVFADSTVYGQPFAGNTDGLAVYRARGQLPGWRDLHALQPTGSQKG